MIPVFSPLFDRIAGPQMPASPIPALCLPLFLYRSFFTALFLRGASCSR